MALLTVQEVAKILRVSDETVRRRIQDNSYAAIKTGRQWRLPSSQFDQVFNAAGLDDLKKKFQIADDADAESLM